MFWRVLMKARNLQNEILFFCCTSQHRLTQHANSPCMRTHIHTHIVVLFLLTSKEVLTATAFMSVLHHVWRVDNRVHLFRLNVFSVIQMTHCQMNLRLSTFHSRFSAQRNLFYMSNSFFLCHGSCGHITLNAQFLVAIMLLFKHFVA